MQSNQNGMNSHLWVIGVTLSLTATLFGTLGRVLLELSHTSSQTLSVKAVATASVALVAEGGSIWYRPETYVIFVAALSSAGGGIYVLDLSLREHDALYLVAIYQAFLILIGSVSGVIFFR
ncbi:hypothetical protein PsorP6_012732 [Peronosclerospora sorghi]|uniref:Uncharacterized protein n=1 Tax=Peronosclerospora sorghi TaxID=230839 RepID=A0ACC0WHM6_9STRA|nr:hypothetical protein PsorP6_012732 [Peronosclerospora sorghi]